MTDVTIVTHAAIPLGAPDDQMLGAALERRGAAVRYAVWNQADVDWAATPLTVVRSTWDYHLNPVAWLDWVRRTAEATRLVNPPETIVWNSEKTYLAELARAGVATAPTVVFERGAAGEVARRAADRGWDDVIVKPAVGAGSHGARRFRGAAIAREGAMHAAALAADTRVLLQPYLTEVEAARERSLVFIGGQPRYAFTKPPFLSATGGATTALMPHAATAEEVALAIRAIAAAPGSPLVARVDLVPTSAGPVVMELELVEPTLAFDQNPESADALAGLLIESLAHDA